MTDHITNPQRTEDVAQRRQVILIVDDDITIRSSVVDLLKISGYEPLSATDGLEALGVMQRSVPDLIISDISMPSMDGYAFFDAVRDNTAWTLIPFIFLTALGQAHDIRKGIRLGVDQYITKPFEPDDLLVAVEARLRRIQEIEAVTHNDVEAMKNRLMTAISHELRTPLTYIYGYITLLGEGDSEYSAEERQDMVSAIQKGADRLVKLVEDLIMVARLDSGQIGLEITHGQISAPVDALLNPVLAGRSGIIAERGLELDVQVGPGLEVMCAPDHLRDAFGRLLDNAIKFTKSPGGRIWVTTDQDAGVVRIHVQDDGLGVGSDKQKLLFQTLRQIDRERHEQQGLGVGLVIARGIVEAHGGHIEVTSEGIPGRGSIFTIVMPGGG